MTEEYGYHYHVFEISHVLIALIIQTNRHGLARAHIASASVSERGECRSYG